MILIWTATNVRVLKPDAALNMPIYYDRWHDCNKVDPNVLKFFEVCEVCLDRTSFSVNFYMYLSVLRKRPHSVNLDMESKAGHFPKQTILMEVLVTWIYFMIELICNNDYKYDYANETNNLETNTGTRFKSEEYLRDFL